MVILSRVYSYRICLCLFWLAWVCTYAMAAHYSQVFRGRNFDPKLFRPTGSNAHQAISTTPLGLRIALKADHDNGLPVGLIGRPSVRGDFEITMAFNVIRSDKPTKGKGVGVSIWIGTASTTREAASVAWYLQLNGREVFSGMRAFTPPDGKREYQRASIKAETRVAKLRLTRSGSSLICLVAPEGSNKFKEIFRTDFGTEDVETVRFAVENGGSPTVVDALIDSISVESQDLPSQPAPPAASKSWWWGILGFLAVTLLLGVYRVWRSKRSARPVGGA